MGCVCHTHTPVRLHCLQRFVSHNVLQSHKELEVSSMSYLIIGLIWAIGVVTEAILMLIWDMIK
jgi:hypothetical protein